MTYNKWTLKLLLPFFLLLMVCSNVLAAVPQSISYQAYLKDNTGLPVNATVNVTFRLYDDAVAGAQLWSDTLLAVSVSDGLFSVSLGTLANPLPVNSTGNQLWLSIEVASDGELNPRIAINSVLNSFQAQDSVSVGGYTENQLQNRVAGSCAAGQSIRVINTDGSILCEFDNDTTYNGNDFALSNQTCTAGMVVTGINATGNFICSNTVATNTTNIATNVSDLDAHTGNTLNPHGVSATQLGLVTNTELSNHENNASDHHTRYTDAEALTAVKAVDGAGSGLHADSLDGLSGSSFLRSSASDSHISGTLSFASNTTLALNGLIKVGSTSSTDNDALFFDDGLAEYFRWAETPDRFEFTDDLLVSGSLTVGPTGGVGFGYNQMRNSTVDSPVSGDISNKGDLFIGYDLEVGGEIYANRVLYMNGRNSTGHDADQHIYFYNSDDRQGEFLRWNDFEGRFDLSSHLRVTDQLTVNNDLFVSNDLHVSGKSYFNFQHITYSPIAIDGTRVCDLRVSGDCYWKSVNYDCAAGKAVVSGGCKCVHSSSGNNECHITDNMALDWNTWACAAESPTAGAQIVGSLTCAKLEQ